MKALLVIAIILGLAVLVGWIRYSDQRRQPQITIETEKMKADTEEIVEKSKELVGEAKREVDQVVDDWRDRKDNESASDPAPSPPVTDTELAAPALP